MRRPFLESAIDLSALSVRADSTVASTELEREVVNLFDELRDRLLRYVLGFRISGADAEEIVQEAFLSLFRHLQLGRSRHNLRGWLFRVVHNLALKKLSVDQRRPDRTSLDPEDSERHVADAINPEEQAIVSQRQVRLLATLNSLPVLDQRCLQLRAEGLRYREIAEVLGVSLGGVATLLARSLSRLGRVSRR